MLVCKKVGLVGNMRVCYLLTPSLYQLPVHVLIVKLFLAKHGNPFFAIVYQLHFEHTNCQVMYPLQTADTTTRSIILLPNNQGLSKDWHIFASPLLYNVALSIGSLDKHHIAIYQSLVEKAEIR